MKKNVLPTIIKMILISISLYITFILFFNIQEIKKTILSMPFSFFCLSILMTYVGYALRFLKWNYFLKEMNIKIPLKENVIIFFIGIAMSITPGKIGELIKSYFIKKYSNIAIAKTVPIIISDRMTDLFSLMIIIAIGSIFISFHIIYFIIVAFLLVGVIVILKIKRISYTLISIITKIKLFKSKKESLMSLYNYLYELIRIKRLFITTLISVFAWYFQSLTLYILLLGVHIHMNVLEVSFIFSVGILISSLSMLPNGLGLTEANIVGMLVYFKISLSVAISVALINSLISLWIGVFIGIILLIIRRKEFM